MDLQTDYHFILIKNKFPRISLGIELRWASKDLEPYIIGLLQDTRENTRQGFPVQILSSLGSLLEAHGKEYPQYRFSSGDLWDMTLSK